MPVQGDPFTYGRARVFHRPVDPREGNEWLEMQGVTSMTLRLADSAGRSAAAMRAFVEAYRDHRLWRASGRRLGPPCAKCALPMDYKIECKWWICRCGHTVIREDVGYEGWRWWLFRWTGLTVTPDHTSRERVLARQRGLYRQWSKANVPNAPGTSHHGP